MPKAKTNKATKPRRIDWFGSHFDMFQKNGNGYKALCPLHDDTNPSLSIKEDENGKLLIHCHAGCNSEHILHVVGLTYYDLMPNAKHVVAEYDYLDEQGEILYQVVRYEPKEFRQRSPKPDGGWSWSTQGVRRVLYRLPELVKVNPKKPVFIVGGEKDADCLAKLGLIATTNVGGEGPGKWLDEYNESLKGRRVVIVPDNDATGIEHATNVATALYGVASSVRILALPNLPEHGDVSDWLDAGGSMVALLRLAKRTRFFKPSRHRAIGLELPIGSNAKGDYPSGAGKSVKTPRKQGQTPEGLPEGCTQRVGNSMGDGAMGTSFDPMRKVEVSPFPVDILPGQLRDFVLSTAGALPCPPDFPGAMMLAVLGTFIGRKRCIEVKSSWREYPLLWIACVARSGERKSPAFEIATAPLRKTQKMLLAKHTKEYEQWEQANYDGPAPIVQQILTTDTTIEALKVVLEISSDGIIYPADELSGWVRSIGQYKGGKGDDRQIWLSIWSGIQIVTNRKSSPRPLIIDNPFVSIVGSIQPDALGDLINLDREDGLAARVLFNWPEPIRDNGWTEEVLKQNLVYTSICCEQLWNLDRDSKPVCLIPAAKDIWVDWVNKHRQEKPLDSLRATWSKAEGHCLRLTLILHLARFYCNVTRSQDVDETSMEGGIALIEYFKSHSQRVYGHALIKSDQGKVAKTLAWIRKQGGSATARLAKMNGFTRDSNEAKALFYFLQELGYGSVSEGKQGSVKFTLNPD